MGKSFLLDALQQAAEIAAEQKKKVSPPSSYKPQGQQPYLGIVPAYKLL
jgi:hypothetical protein